MIGCARAISYFALSMLLLLGALSCANRHGKGLTDDRSNSAKMAIHDKYGVWSVALFEHDESTVEIVLFNSAFQQLAPDIQQEKGRAIAAFLKSNYAECNRYKTVMVSFESAHSLKFHGWSYYQRQERRHYEFPIDGL